MPQASKPLYLHRDLMIVFMVTLIAVMGVTSISPVFPLIRKVFGITAGQVGLLITAFTLPGIFLSPVLGIMADRFGRKKVLVPSLILFSIAGTTCAYMKDFDWLLFFRFLQGTGAAAIGALNITLIGDLYTGKERATAMGYNASVLSFGTASYPLIGGGLAAIAWYFPFFLSILALPVGLLVLFSLKNPEPSKGEAFGKYLKEVLQSLLNSTVAGLFLLSILTFILLYGSFLTYLPILLYDKFDIPPYQIGIILSFASVTTAITSSQLGKLSAKYSYKSMLNIVYGFYILSMLIIPWIHSIWWMLLPSAIFGAAQGINIPVLQTMLANHAPLQYRAAFMSANGMVLRLGQTLGPVLMGAAYLVAGISAAFYAGALTAVIMVIVVVLMIGK